MKLTIYSREVRDYYNGEEITQYMLAPEAAEKRDYMDTDCLAVSGEVTHTLESRGDGAYSEDGTPFGWCAAALEAYDSEGDFLQSYSLGYITEFDAKRWAY